MNNITPKRGPDVAQLNTPEQLRLLSDKFLQRTCEKAARGDASAYWWFRTARIITRIENNLPVGHWRKRKRKSQRQGRGTRI